MAKAKKSVSVSQILIGFSMLCVALSALGYFFGDIWLASTQWLLVAGVLGLFGIYFKGK